ncbi:MAG: site-specific DNA-methyltransferase [Thiobacillus sp.]|nr:site-specific DNA-methyltransferase [Thiobacillus sp.]
MIEIRDSIVRRPVDALVPYARNSRTHSDAQVAQIAASMREWGWTSPVLVDEAGGIIAGHGRVLAARQLGLHEVPVIVAAGWTDAQKRAYVIADNKLAENAGWDSEMLALELGDLQGMEFNLGLIGFDQQALDDLLAAPGTEGNTDPDAVPEPQEEVVTHPGDVWMLGKHRVMCGDSTSIDAVETLIAGAKADMVFTDPPYGMSYGGGRARGDHAKNKHGGVLIKAHGMILGDDKTGDDLIELVRDALATAVASCKTGAATYVCFPWRTYSEFEAAVEDCGLKISACIVWDKKSIGLGNANYRPQHEFIFYCKGGAWYGDKAQSDVWYMSRGDTGAYVHPTQKPVELIERALENSSKGGDTVLDLFGGSGSTLIACEKTGREARLMDLDGKYVDVIVRRWQEFTGGGGHAGRRRPHVRRDRGGRAVI